MRYFSMSYKRLLVPAILLIAILGATTFIVRQSAEAPVAEIREQTSGSEPAGQSASFDKNRYSTDEPGSIWQIVNKSRALPADYVPADLIVPDVRLRLATSEQQMKFRQVSEADLIAMFKAAKDDGVTLVFGSGYRSYALQKQFYDSYVARDGQAAADRYSARPGTSEHQTGLSFDVTSISGKCHLEVCFEDLPEGQWVRDHAHEYGFIIRYPNGKENVTGYQYEPWHLRYVGRELSAEIHRTNQTLEEFFNLN